MKLFRFPGYLLAVLFLFSCKTYKNVTATTVPSISGLKFIDEYVVPNNTMLKGTKVGGLSGIDYDSARNIYYIICDERSETSPARFYKAKITISDKGIDSVEFTDVVTFRNAPSSMFLMLLGFKGKPFPSHDLKPARSPDPESIRYDRAMGVIAWGNEGERIVNARDTALQDPSVNLSKLNGKWAGAYDLGMNADIRVHLEEKGIRKNGATEGITFSDDFRYLFVSMEEPLYEDGPRAGNGDSTGKVRILKLDAGGHRHLHEQYFYTVDAVPYVANPPGAYKINGISEILYMGEDQLLVVERAFATGRNSCGIRIYLADLKDPNGDSSGNRSFITPRAIPKKLLLNMDDLGRYIDNVEGVSFGPILPNGHRSLIFVSDNNFNDSQKTQFFLFEILP